ncbi:MAG: class I adenylate-forming enzyme family protein, partial [Promethearchaeota archaeon]
ADKSLKAIQDYRVTAFGQIPSLFVMEWRLPDYDKYDLSSLRFAIYGGQSVSRQFLEKLSKMAPQFGSGLGLTEMSGFVSYTPLDGTVDDILASLGHDFPITPLSIRKPMREDGYAGDELPDGEIGEICYKGPQVFKGYYKNEEATRKTISKDGWCYTGDLGWKDEEGLHLAGRGKFVIKPKGYQVYPPEVEAHIEKLPEVSLAAVVGAKHEVFSEGIIAFVELKKGKKITAEKIMEHCKSLAAYKRPSLIVFMDEIPLNRVDKTDYKQLYDMVPKIIEEERKKGGWDAK